MERFDCGEVMRILSSKTVKKNKAANQIWQALYLSVSLTPALAICRWTLSRPVLQMGSDQDLMWVSEALRLSRGLGPSYADHPGAFWSILYALTVKGLSLFSTIPILQGESITVEGLRILIQVTRVENALIAGCLGFLCCQILVNLKINRLIALIVNLAISCSTPLLFAASAVRHELISVAMMLISCLFFQKISSPRRNECQRKAYGIASILAIFAATFSKQQSLIILPFIFWIGLATAYLANSALLQSWVKQWEKLRVNGILILFAVWSLSWLISAFPDIDMINLPAWLVINFLLSGIVLLSIPMRQAVFAPVYKASIVAGVIEILITRAISANWWRQAVTGFPSWLIMFANQSVSVGDQPAMYASTLHEYFALIFSLPSVAIAAVAATAICSLYITIKSYYAPPNQLSRANFRSRLAVSISWLLSLTIVAICLARANPPYAIYFFPCIMITCALAFSAGFKQNPESYLAISALKTASLFLLIAGTTRSISNFGHLQQIGMAGLPESAICMSHNMDPAMRLTAIGSCPDFKSQSDNKAMYNDWWRGPL